MATLIINSSAEKSLNRHHPWIFSNAIKKIKGAPESGETVGVQTSKGHFLGYGSFSPQSKIKARMWTFDPEELITPVFFRKKLKLALEKRKHLMFLQGSAFRVVNAESDGLPGLIIDKYNDYLVCQFLSCGAEFWKADIVACLIELFPIAGIYERSDNDGREKEGLSQQTGGLWGKEPPDLIEIKEHDISFWVNIKTGHKTGFYLDQRENRELLSTYAKEKKVLNCFSYTGGFSLWALKGGAASVTSIDISEEAITLLQKNASLNNMPPERITVRCEDVFHTLRKFRDAADQFDLIILDPPKFAASGQSVQKAARGYKDINLLAIKLLTPGGYLFTFSCSGHITPPLFQKIVSDAAIDAGRDAQIVKQLHQADDHPVALNFPEGLYLKGLLIRVF
ncbi:MAG: class I SAM-dependent rRNA methyltransferase [Proteobacteria bacterium]|nr:class I SAM-dependent rRNA methyltransferase [Pseudomonadota bacterium]